MRSRDRVAIGWLDPGTVDGRWTADLIRLVRSRESLLHESTIRIACNGLLSRGRNELVRTFLDRTDAAWLLMLDTDHQLPVIAFDKVIAAAHDAERPVVSGLYFAAYPGDLYPTPVPTIYRLTAEGRGAPIHDYPPDSVIPIDACGAGFLLAHRSALDAIRSSAVEPDWCWFADGPVGGAWMSEDITFCAQLGKHGIPLHAHTGAVLPHHKDYWLDDRHHPGGTHG